MAERGERSGLGETLLGVLPDARSRRVARGAAWVATGLLCLSFLSALPSVHRVRVNDFPAYWAAGRSFLSGHPELIYSTQWKWFTNLPVVAVLCAPLGALEYDTAWQVLWWISVASLVGTFALLLFAVKRGFPPLDPVAVAVVAAVWFSFTPVMLRCLSLGQTTPLMVLLFTGVYLLCKSGHDKSAGLLLGLICVIKIPPMLLLPLLVLRRRLAMAAAALAVVAAAVAASYVFFGAELMQQYADRVIWDNFGRVHAAFNNQSLDGAFMRVLTDRGLADWVPVERPALERVVVYAVVGAIALALLLSARSLLWPAWRAPESDLGAASLELELGLGVALMVLVFPIVWIHYYLFLAVPLALLPFWWVQRGLPLRRGVVGLFVVGTWLAGGFAAQENAWYAERETQLWLRLTLNAQPMGALLLVAASLAPLAAIARRVSARAGPEGGQG